ncbi:MAG: hypothetical protein GX829_05700 [Clostridium sp.]|nr:hypothetical protein [Clostridium sp.]
MKNKNLSISVYRKLGGSLFLLHEDHRIISSDQVPLIENYNLDQVMTKLKLMVM